MMAIANGKTRDAGSSPPPLPPDETLRARAAAVDATLGVWERVGHLWLRLMDGQVSLVDWFYSPTRWFALLRESGENEVNALSGRDRKRLQASLLGRSQKCAASDCGVAASTISVTAQTALSRMGVPVTVRRVPPMLTLLARAANGLETPRTRVSSMLHDERSYSVLSIDRPEALYSPLLSQAEYSVLCAVVEAKSYAEIAKVRQVSIRTVANQLASAFHRLGVSGRAELVDYLLTEPPAELAGLHAEQPAARHRLEWFLARHSL